MYCTLYTQVEVVYYYANFALIALFVGFLLTFVISALQVGRGQSTFLNKFLIALSLTLVQFRAHAYCILYTVCCTLFQSPIFRSRYSKTSSKRVQSTFQSLFHTFISVFRFCKIQETQSGLANILEILTCLGNLHDLFYQHL